MKHGKKTVKLRRSKDAAPISVMRFGHAKPGETMMVTPEAAENLIARGGWDVVGKDKPAPKPATRKED